MPLRNQTELQLPFQGSWFCFWGGDTLQLNYHRRVVAQRFAFDFVKVSTGDSFYKGNVRRNANSWSFGQPILAPGDGEVIETVTDITDNKPGFRSRESLFGNYVLIKHCEAEYSVLAHLKRGSVQINAGDNLSRGEQIGLCGNSGSSTDPHLHYHLQTTADIPEGFNEVNNAEGIKPYFTDVLRERDNVISPRRSCSPIKGDFVAPGSVG